MTFAMSFNRFNRIVMSLFFSGPRQTSIVVDPDYLRVRMGAAFIAIISRTAIVRTDRIERRVISAGAHGWGGRWLVNGTSHGLVTLTIEPAARGRVLGVGIKLRQLTLSLEQPDMFLAAVNETGTN